MCRSVAKKEPNVIVFLDSCEANAKVEKTVVDFTATQLNLDAENEKKVPSTVCNDLNFKKMRSDLYANKTRSFLQQKEERH